MKNLTISSKIAMNQYIKSHRETNLKIKDFEFSRHPKISVQAKILSSERNGKGARSKAFQSTDNFHQQISRAQDLFNSKISNTFPSTKYMPCKLSSNISETKLLQSSAYKTDLTSEEYDSLLASIESEIEKLHKLKVKSGAKMCSLCRGTFENSIVMNNHYYAFHQTFN